MIKNYIFANGILEVNYTYLIAFFFSFINIYKCFFIFEAGFVFLPFLWAVNAIWFAKEAFVEPHYEEQKQIKRCKLQII